MPRLNTRDSLIRIAQRMANNDGRPRWVKWTSLGWRCELYPQPATDPGDKMTVLIIPQPKDVAEVGQGG